MSHARVRIAESLGEMGALRGEIEEWRGQWDVNDALGAHLTQLDLLVGVVVRLVDEIARRANAINPEGDAGAVYDACRRADLQLLHARRLWRWYADKLDQRAGPADDATTRSLRAADELTWSCWKTAFTVLAGEQAALPAAPIPYLAPQFSAFATPRTDPPPDLRPGADDLLRRHIEQLPIPVIGLPPACQRRPWWLIVAAHEASHHVQFELPGLEERTQDGVVAAAHAVSSDADLAEDWRPWCRELFADACAVLLTGPAALWAIAELEMRPAAALRKPPSGSYPPPLVRLAVARSVAEQAGLPAGTQIFPDATQRTPGGGPVPIPAPGSEADPAGWADRLLGCAPAVAGALLTLRTGKGGALRSLGTATARAYDNGIIAAWRKELLGADEPVAEQSLDAARFAAAASVDAWQWITREPGSVGELDLAASRLAGRALGLLPDCREPGTRAAGAAADADALARRLQADLDAEVPADSGRGQP